MQYNVKLTIIAVKKPFRLNVYANPVAAQSVEEAKEKVAKTEIKELMAGGLYSSVEVESAEVLKSKLMACPNCGGSNTECRLTNVTTDFISDEGMERANFGTFVFVCKDCGHNETRVSSSSGSPFNFLHCPFCQKISTDHEQRE